MFAVLDSDSLAITGVSHTSSPGDGLTYVPLSKEQYLEFVNHPEQQRRYKGQISDDHIVKIIPVPDLTYAESTLVEIPKVDKNTTVHLLIQVRPDRIELVSHLRDEIEITVFSQGLIDVPIAHGKLHVNKPIEHRAKDHTKLKVFVANPAKEYTYGVVFA